jgi:uncharacterized protein (TIGR02996 family)
MTEADFIIEILSRPDEEFLRLVYADWLEDFGDRRSAFLRLEHELVQVRREVETQHRNSCLQETETWLAEHERFSDMAAKERDLQRQLEELSAGISPLWLRWIERNRIENCEIRFDFQCPLQWDQLTLTNDVNVRHCQQCDRNVHFCKSIEAARAHAAMDRCVAVAATVAREPGDIPSTESILGMLDFEAIRKHMPPPRKPLTKRTLPRPLIEQIRRESPSFLGW